MSDEVKSKVIADLIDYESRMRNIYEQIDKEAEERMFRKEWRTPIQYKPIPYANRITSISEYAITNEYEPFIFRNAPVQFDAQGNSQMTKEQEYMAMGGKPEDAVLGDE